MSEFKIGTIGTYLEENDGKRPAPSPAGLPGGIVVETMGGYQERKAAEAKAPAAKPAKKAAARKADDGDE